MNKKYSDLSIIIPAYNEEEAIDSVIEDISTNYKEAEIIVINDGSTDRTGELLEKYKSITVFTHRHNRGYGAALKSGMRIATKRNILWFDADGQHTIDTVDKVVNPVLMQDYDAAIGARKKESAYVIKRMPGKWLLKITAQLVARQKIPDLNCGLRCFKAVTIKKYLHLLPNNFSASSTSTLIFMKRNYKIKFVPILTLKREGKSSVKIIADGINVIVLILNIFILFDAFLFFSANACFLFIIGTGYSYHIMAQQQQGIPILGAIIILSSLLVFLLGIVSSQISKVRLDLLGSD
jgi:glycosyltransferase involved in cell wall biosynthesis